MGDTFAKREKKHPFLAAGNMKVTSTCIAIRRIAKKINAEQ